MACYQLYNSHHMGRKKSPIHNSLPLLPSDHIPPLPFCSHSGYLQGQGGLHRPQPTRLNTALLCSLHCPFLTTTLIPDVSPSPFPANIPGALEEGWIEVTLLKPAPESAAHRSLAPECSELDCNSGSYVQFPFSIFHVNRVQASLYGYS